MKKSKKAFLTSGIAMAIICSSLAQMSVIPYAAGGYISYGTTDCILYDAVNGTSLGIIEEGVCLYVKEKTEDELWGFVDGGIFTSEGFKQAGYIKLSAFCDTASERFEPKKDIPSAEPQVQEIMPSDSEYYLFDTPEIKPEITTTAVLTDISSGEPCETEYTEFTVPEIMTSEIAAPVYRSNPGETTGIVSDGEYIAAMTETAVITTAIADFASVTMTSTLTDISAESADKSEKPEELTEAAEETTEDSDKSDDDAKKSENEPASSPIVFARPSEIQGMVYAGEPDGYMEYLAPEHFLREIPDVDNSRTGYIKNEKGSSLMVEPGGDQLAYLARGEKVRVYPSEEMDGCYFAQTDYLYGWMKKEDLSGFSSDQNYEGVPSSLRSYVVTNENGADFMKVPILDKNNRISIANTGDVVRVYDDTSNDDWVKVIYNGRDGYMERWRLTPSDSLSPYFYGRRTFENQSYAAVYNYMREVMGYSDAVAIGILANCIIESNCYHLAFNPDDNGSPSEGLFQWHADRLDRFYTHIRRNGNSIQTQLDFFKYEMFNDENDVHRYLVSAGGSAADFARYFANQYERCASSSVEIRARIAEEIYYSEYVEDYNGGY